MIPGGFPRIGVAVGGTVFVRLNAFKVLLPSPAHSWCSLGRPAAPLTTTTPSGPDSALTGEGFPGAGGPTGIGFAGVPARSPTNPPIGPTCVLVAAEKMSTDAFVLSAT